MTFDSTKATKMGWTRPYPSMVPRLVDTLSHRTGVVQVLWDRIMNQLEWEQTDRLSGLNC